MSQRAIHTKPTKYNYDNKPWLYRFMYSFFFGFVQNDDYTYDLKPIKKVNIFPITSYTYDTFSVLNYDYDYFCGDMNELVLKNGCCSVSAASSGVFWKHTATEFETGFDYFGARYYASDLSIWLSVDALSDKYLSTSPFMYVLGNPIGIIDPNGDSAFVLTAPKGAEGAGHMAILIQREEDGKWALWSKNGTEESSGSTGTNSDDDDGKKAYDSPQAFLDSKDNLTEEGKREYTEGYVIAATKDQDRKMEAAFDKELKKEYNVATSNCAQAVQSALKNAGFNTGRYDSEKHVPTALKQGPSIGDIIIDRIPNLIYGRIKRQNPGGATYKAKPPSVKKAYIPRKTKHI